MRPRLILNVVLVLAVAGLVALLWFDPGQEPPTTPITALNSEKIENITIEYPDAETLRLKRKGEQWLLAAPVQARAENSEVRAILALAERVPTRSYPARESDTAQIGLDKPTQIVTLDNTRISLGANDALDNNRYAQIDDTVYLIPSPIKTSLDPDYSELVARELLPEDSRIKQLQLPGFSLSPTEQGGWQVSPATRDKGADAAQFTIDAWKRARAVWTKPADLKQPGKGEIRITTQAGSVYTFQIIARQPQLILRAPEIAVDYHLAANQVAPLLDMQHPETAKSETLKTRPDVSLDAGQ